MSRPYVLPLRCGCDAYSPCSEHSRDQWEAWLEDIAEQYAEARGGIR